jgi:hypothetical protein
MSEKEDRNLETKKVMNVIGSVIAFQMIRMRFC